MNPKSWKENNLLIKMREEDNKKYLSDDIHKFQMIDENNLWDEYPDFRDFKYYKEFTYVGEIETYPKTESNNEKIKVNMTLENQFKTSFGCVYAMSIVIPGEKEILIKIGKTMSPWVGLSKKVLSMWNETLRPYVKIAGKSNRQGSYNSGAEAYRKVGGTNSTTNYSVLQNLVNYKTYCESKGKKVVYKLYAYTFDLEGYEKYNLTILDEEVPIGSIMNLLYKKAEALFHIRWEEQFPSSSNPYNRPLLEIQE